LTELAPEGAGANEDRQQEDEFDERESDQHSGLHFADGFGLSSHSVHGGGSNHAEADGNTESSESECEREKAHVFYPLCFSELVKSRF
jgi:hypothetical protein